MQKGPTNNLLLRLVSISNIKGSNNNIKCQPYSDLNIGACRYLCNIFIKVILVWIIKLYILASSMDLRRRE